MSSLEVELILTWFGNQSKCFPHKRALRKYYARINGERGGRNLSRVGVKIYGKEGGSKLD